ncbi:hypothetical protein ACP70R_036250 [Stipagrostis hirtigluma subsp. patula]
MVAAVGVLKKEPEESVVEVESHEDDGGLEKDSHEAEGEKVKRRRKKACDPHKKRACVDCTKRCARIHGRASASSQLPSSGSSKARSIPTVPSFFKVMMGYFSENMEIPTPFAKTILDLASSNIYLEDAFGLRWRVRVCLRDGVLSFGHGWKNFVLDHAISCGEFLVFRQIARSVFTVQMFAPTAVERLYLCEKNKRQSRKRKPRQKTTCPGNQTLDISKKNFETCKKKQRTDGRNYPAPSDANISVHICVDSEVEVLKGETETANGYTTFKGKERGCISSVLEPSVFDATGSKQPESMVVIDVSPNTKHMKNLAVNANKPEAYDDLSCSAAGNVMMEDKGSDYKHQDRPIQLYCAPELQNENTEIENDEGSILPENVDTSGPLTIMDLNEESIDDIYLSADIYEFESDIGKPEAFSVDMNMEGLSTNGQTSGFSCIENISQKHDSSMGVGQLCVMSETLPCTENKQMTDPPGTWTDAVIDPAHDIDINAFPANEPSPFGEDTSYPPTDAEGHPSECALNGCNKDECNGLSPCKGNQAAEKEGFGPANSSAKQDKPQDGQFNMHDSAEQNAAEIMSINSNPHELPRDRKSPLQTDSSVGLQSGSVETGGVLALAANSRKFCVAVPASDQTWLELPGRLPVLPRTKKQGRKVVILKDPCNRLWPVLYQCTPRFNGFITGWVDISRENNLREGDTCEFKLSDNSELSFQVRMPCTQ